MPTLTEEIHDVETQILALRAKLAELREKMTEPVADFEFEEWNGPVQLSELFGERNELLVIHNMGSGCRYCTLWADGLNGIFEHLSSRAAVALVTPEDIDVAMQFAESRHWRFRILSDTTRAFGQATGYWNSATQSAHPGISAFCRAADGAILRTGTASFGEYDDFCPLWHILSLLKDGVDGWEPQYRYLA